MIFDEIKKYAIEESNEELSMDDNNLADLIKDISFRNLKTNKLERIKDIIFGKKTLLNLFISPCIGCPEMKRLSILKQMVQKIDKNDSRIIILFGRGNGFDIIKEYSEKAQLNDTQIIIGIIEKDGAIYGKNYYRIFQYDVDPRTLILDRKGTITFSEKLGEENKIVPEYLIRKLS